MAGDDSVTPEVVLVLPSIQQAVRVTRTHFFVIGKLGEMHHGNWYGGHYGWAWPHGLYSVIAPALIAAVNATLITGDDRALALPRNAVNRSLESAVRRRGRPSKVHQPSENLT